MCDTCWAPQSPVASHIMLVVLLVWRLCVGISSGCSHRGHVKSSVTCFHLHWLNRICHVCMFHSCLGFMGCMIVNDAFAFNKYMFFFLHPVFVLMLYYLMKVCVCDEEVGEGGLYCTVRLSEKYNNHCLCSLSMCNA